MNKTLHDAAVRRLQAALGHTFANPALLECALTHRSFSSRHNERFEFVGDAVLNYTVARMLFDTYPDLPEGRLSRLRANLVNQTVLAETAASLNLGDALLLGPGELKSGGFRRPSILADAMEAVFAAVCLDADFAAAEAVVRRLFHSRVQNIDCGEKEAKDAKTRLQEALQAQRLALPKYRIDKQEGEGENAWFTVSCDLGELGFVSTAQASGRRAAEQEAARTALEWLAAHRPPAKTPQKRRQK
ncbi:Ribonuclease 3 [Kingella potus]|uniref:Ribonuclease 3 n=1 Tax=Kingella potus TaxID=265175 RepID=A0A377R1F9_9NEIS|nr:ribonuclease III [Kingella potus]STR00929.1 Ribonuclease 3 [Kingella potus]